MDLGKDWTLLEGSPKLAKDLRFQSQNAQVLKNMAKNKCSVCIEGTKCVVADGKGKKVLYTFDLSAVAGAEVSKLAYNTYTGAAGVVRQNKLYAVVMLRDGKIYSFLDAQDSTAFRLNQLVKALGPGAPATPAGPWACAKCGAQNAPGTKFYGECGGSRA